MSKLKEQREIKQASFGYALFVIIGFLVIAVGGTFLLNASISAMFLVSYLFLVPAIMRLGYSFGDIWEAMTDSIKGGVYALVILLSIGALIGSWIVAGTVPAILYWGMNIISAKFFMVTAFIICAIFSVICGTSWGTLGTIGVALFGVGISLGVPQGCVVGAIISGAYFGDMLSPLSDSPNIISGAVGVNLMDYIKKFAVIVAPAFVITDIVFLIMGFSSGVGGSTEAAVAELQGVIAANFKIGFVAFLPIILVIVLLILKVDSIMTILISAVFSLILAPFYQGAAVGDLMSIFWNGYSIESGSEMLDTLLNRGGALSMSDTCWMMLLAFGMVGACQKANIMSIIVAPIVKGISKFWQMTLVSQITSIIGNCMGVNNFALIMSGTILRPIYEEKNIDKVNLAIALNGTGTVMNSLIPWNAGSIFCFGLYGVAVSQWAMYSIFSWVMPLTILALAFMGKYYKSSANTVEE